MTIATMTEKLNAIINQDWRETGLLFGQHSIEVVDTTGRTHVKIGDFAEVILRPENPVGEI